MDKNINLGQMLNEWRNTDAYKGQGDIHWLVWLVENPESPLSFVGAADLYTHDCIHLILNKLGMDLNSEAYVIGFTMGNSAKIDRDRNWQYKLFLWIAWNIYPEGYRFDTHAKHAFVEGWDHGFKKPKRDIARCRFAYSDDLNNLRTLWMIK